MTTDDDLYKISHLTEIDFKKFNVNVNVADLLALAEYSIKEIFGDTQTGYTQIIKNLEREYLAKKACSELLITKRHDQNSSSNLFGGLLRQLSN